MKKILLLIPLVILLAGFADNRNTKAPTNLPVDFTHVQNGNSVTLDWTVSPPPAGMVVKWLFLQYQYQPNLHRKYNHPSTIRISPYTQYLPPLSNTFTESGLAPGKYLFNISGAYGDLSNSLSSFVIWSEGIEIIVP